MLQIPLQYLAHMQTLQNHFLLAMPSLSDPYFERSLVYLCEHNEEGAMGLVVNIPVDMSLDAMLTQLKLAPPASPDLKQPVLQGGPVHADRGFVLHSFRPGFNSTLQVGDELMVTTSKDILETLGTEQAPDHWLVALGYAGWSAGQLEQELVDGAWLVIPPNPDLVFKTPIHQRWQQAAASIGVNPIHLSSDIGHS
ncbi:YqgE/AlgH family protein [Aeromonas salmonicida]|nr:YqgE/AlgH family protein [Aeromonas salmonicida]RSM30676.1 YqgE/AlgH family protein [Aeromonas salmonicida]